MDYIWLDDQSPILNQLPGGFLSAAILLHPFVQMPIGWEQSKRQSEFEHVYPNREEILMSGNSVSWQEMMSDTGLRTYHEMELALKTSISALKSEYARQDLANKLNANWKTNRYYPTDDSISPFFIESILRVLSSNGAKKINFSAPIFDKIGCLESDDTVPLDILDLSPNELILSDENAEFVFMSVFDSFFTVFLYKGINIEELVISMKWDAIICDKDTSITWYHTEC
ncbi:DUF2711 family protein [Paenibacillus sp. BC26]|uniref:DUF2711 family protein n=1 Tax=Paenibacillus sp. BC26 TaxID=1881032 RepID=UPI0008E81DE6|nr:DUF2711 family protein [Paenibacillus sp. BC26]SFS77109.1 Protein of unknown function [Paenibacillus sp. BC26]